MQLLRILFALVPLLALGCLYEQATLPSGATRADYAHFVECVSPLVRKQQCIKASWELHTLVAKSTGCSLDSDCRVIPTEDPLAPPWIAITTAAEPEAVNLIAGVRTACGEVDHWVAQPHALCRNHRCVLSARFPWPRHCNAAR